MNLLTFRRGNSMLPIVARFVASFFTSAKEAYYTFNTLKGGEVIVVEFDDDLTTIWHRGVHPFVESGITFQVTDDGFIKAHLLFQGVSILVLIEQGPLLVHIFNLGDNE